MDDPYHVIPSDGPVNGQVRPPGSKSLTNRALVIAALADGPSRLDGALDSRDTEVMIEGLQQLGITITHDSQAATIEVTGCAGRLPAKQATLWLENSGTSMRFLTALVTLGQGQFTLDGNARMRERPLAELVDALRGLGVEITCEANHGGPPVHVLADGLAGGTTSINGSVSSQFLSGLLMAAACARNNTRITLDGPLVSRPYLEMTMALMTQFGADVRESPQGTFEVVSGGYTGGDYQVEPDASAASYFLAAAAITGGRVTVEGLDVDSLQGDVAFATALAQMGCTLEEDEQGLTISGRALQGIEIDMNAISDTAQTLAVVAAFAEGPTRIRGIAHARVKETDRVAAMVCELQRLGLDVHEHDDGLTIHPGPLQPTTIETYDDHRMAMSFALAGLKVPGISVSDPGCTAKTYPDYFSDLERLCGVSR